MEMLREFVRSRKQQTCVDLYSHGTGLCHFDLFFSLTLNFYYIFEKFNELIRNEYNYSLCSFFMIIFFLSFDFACRKDEKNTEPTTDLKE